MFALRKQNTAFFQASKSFWIITAICEQHCVMCNAFSYLTALQMLNKVEKSRDRIIF